MRVAGLCASAFLAWRTEEPERSYWIALTIALAVLLLIDFLKIVLRGLVCIRDKWAEHQDRRAAFDHLPSDAQEQLLLRRLAGRTRVTVDADGTIDAALWTSSLVRNAGKIKGNVQGFNWGVYQQYDLKRFAVKRIDTRLAQIKRTDPARYQLLEQRAAPVRR